MGRKPAYKVLTADAPPDFQRVYEELKAWRYGPGKFVQECICDPMGYKLSTQQKKAYDELGKLVIAKSAVEKGEELTGWKVDYAKKIGISIQSGKGTGKDFWMSGAVIWFLEFWEHAYVPCVAPTQHQLDTVLWAEIARLNDKNKLKRFITHQARKVFNVEGEGKTRFAFPITANPKADPETQVKTMSGLHSRHMMICVDEADGLPDPTFRELESTMTSPINFALVIFNPTKHTGFAIETQKSERWIQIHWDAEESENVSRESILAAEEKYGRDSNYFRVFVKGIPPTAEKDALIPWDAVHDAIDRDIDVSEEFDGLILGVDVGGGGDASVICPRRGGKVYPLLKNMSPDSTEVGSWVGIQMDTQDAEASFVDVIGIGNGVVGELRRQGRRVYAVDVRRTPRNTARFHKLRDELWWKVREAFMEGTISIPKDSELMGELTMLKFDDTTGKVKVEGKRELRHRGEASPNKADALMHTFFLDSRVFKHKAKDKYHGAGSKYYSGVYPARQSCWMGA
jgi:hypothetical protein